MTIAGARGRSAVVTGVGDTPLGRHDGASSHGLMTIAARAALDQAGLTLKDVDGLLTVPTRTDAFITPSVALAEYLGLRPRFSDTVMLGGASGTKMVVLAKLAVEAGLADCVLVAAGEPRLTAIGAEATLQANALVGHPDFEVPLDLSMPSMYALVASAHMRAYGTTRRQLAHVATTTRHHASLTETARFRDPLSVEQVEAAAPVSDPFGVFDCTPLADGACAVVVTSRERADGGGVRILGTGEAHGHEHLVFAPQLTSFASVRSGRDALAAAGVAAGEIDVAELYDCFTITPLVLLEDIGFCAPGDAGPFVEAGETRLGGRLPVNTHGGLLSGGQPGASGGLFHVVEAVRQLRGGAARRQVGGAELALVHGVGGVFASHCTLVLGAPGVEGRT